MEPTDITKKRGKGRRSDIPWGDIRAAYEAGDTDLTRLGRQFGVSRNSIRNRARAESWAVIEREKERVQEAARSNLVDLATKRALKKLGGEQAIEQHAEMIAEGLKRHAEIERLLLDVAKVALDDAKSGQFKMVAGSDRVTVAEARERSVNTAAKAIDKSREIHGLTVGKPSVGSEEDGKKKADQVVLVVRERKETA